MDTMRYKVAFNDDYMFHFFTNDWLSGITYVAGIWGTWDVHDLDSGELVARSTSSCFATPIDKEG